MAIVLEETARTAAGRLMEKLPDVSSFRLQKREDASLHLSSSLPVFRVSYRLACRLQGIFRAPLEFWRSVVFEGDGPIAAIDFKLGKNGRIVLSRMFGGEALAAQWRALEVAGNLAITERQDYELRIIEIPLIKAGAVWLACRLAGSRDFAGDIFVPFAGSLYGKMLFNDITADEFEKVTRAEAIKQRDSELMVRRQQPIKLRIEVGILEWLRRLRLMGQWMLRFLGLRV